MKKIALAVVLLLSPMAAKAEDVFRVVSTHWLDFDGASASTTNAIGNFIKHVRLVCSQDCFYAIAASGMTAYAATRNSTTAFLPASTPVIQIVSPGSKIAAIKVSTAGRIYITELSK